jgi:hypothetical protein
VVHGDQVEADWVTPGGWIISGLFSAAELTKVLDQRPPAQSEGQYAPCPSHVAINARVQCLD